ncbi:Origin specific replication binding factor [Klebsiella pneumoniae]|nr:Origin specific replication binding factor [Klebsiella pneumoniae]
MREPANRRSGHRRASSSSGARDSGTVLGVTLVDVMNEFHRYSREKGLHTGGAERFPWSHPVMYWVVTDTRRAMYQRQLSEAETEKYAAKKLEDWALKVARRRTNTVAGTGSGEQPGSHSDKPCQPAAGVSP